MCEGKITAKMTVAILKKLGFNCTCQACYLGDGFMCEFEA